MKDVAFQGFPTDIKPTVFAMVIAIDPHPEVPDRKLKTGLRAVSAEDLRWRRCNIKSTALLGKRASLSGKLRAQKDETIMYNAQGELTEASISNVFIVKDGVVSTPLLDNQILPGISRHIAVESMRHDGSIQVEERIVTMDEVHRQMKFGLPTPANISGQWSN